MIRPLPKQTGQMSPQTDNCKLSAGKFVISILPLPLQLPHISTNGSNSYTFAVIGMCIVLCSLMVLLFVCLLVVVKCVSVPASLNISGNLAHTRCISVEIP